VGAFREDHGDVTLARTAEGELRLELGARDIRLDVADRTLYIADQFATLVDSKRRKRKRSLRIAGLALSARGVPREDLGVWVEAEGGMTRVFGVEPADLMAADGLEALAGLDALAGRLRAALAPYAGDVRRAFELGRGLDKVLVVDHGAHVRVWARKLFHPRAQLVLEAHADGRITTWDGKRSERVTIHSRHGVTVSGDLVRFVDASGLDLASITLRWIEPEDRLELARRIGQLVDHEAPVRAPEVFGLPAAPIPSGKKLKRLRWLVAGRRR
jgi:hypothetical protein